MIETLRKFASRVTLAQTIANAPQYLLFILIFLIPFSIRHVFSSTWNIQTGAYSDFTSLSLYISDIILVLMAGWLVVMKPRWSIPRLWKWLALSAGLWLLIELLLQNRSTLGLQMYFTIRILFLIVLAPTVANIQVSREKLAWFFTGLGSIQALIATIQFYTQKSIGLYLIGESHLSPTTSGVAKIVSQGTTMIRGYGTFPHSNVLASFLVVTTLFNIYLLIKTYQIPRGETVPRESFTWRTLTLLILLLLNTFGVFVSFSRGGILALGIGMALLLVYILINKRSFRIYHVVAPLIVAVLASILILAPYLSTRTTVSDNSTKERLFYNEIGEKMISDQPWAGLGQGLSVLHMKQYSEIKLQTWEIQPIHNYYLISWAEWGIGAIILLILLIYPITALFKRNINLWNIILLTMGVSVLILFLFDHYFYTIWPTQLLLWIIIGLILKSMLHVEQE